jgi:pilus assembly protein CpaF
MQTRQAGLEQTGAIVLRDLVKEALRTHMSSYRTMKECV